jgi:hypothetical protein
MWQEAAHPVSCRMCEVCLNWLWWRKLHTLGRTMCNTCWRTDYCGSSTLWNADCHWVLLNTDHSSFSNTTGGNWWMILQILVIALADIGPLQNFWERYYIYLFHLRKYIIVNIDTPSVTICMNIVLVKLHPSCWVCGEKFDHPQHDPVAEYWIIMVL